MSPRNSWTHAVRLDPEVDGAEPGGLACGRDDVGAEAELPLQLRRRAGHHPGIEAEAARDDERATAGRLAGTPIRRSGPTSPGRRPRTSADRSRSGRWRP